MKPTHIILHHSLTADSQTVSWGAIRRFHVIDRGYREIGYHFGIELAGPSYEILSGRMPDETGAHTIGYNERSLGICLVGNFDADEPPAAQWRTGIKLVRWMVRQYGIPVDNIIGHREAEGVTKSCPGKMFDLDKFRADVRSGGFM